MAHFLRGKQAGVQNDLSSGITGDFFLLDELANYGLNSQLSALAYDPVQSLLAVGTKDSQFGNGQVYVFGQRRVCVVFNLDRRCGVKELQFCGERLIVLSDKNDITIFNLDTRKKVAAYAPPGQAMALACDSGLDYLLTGLQNGEVVAFDLDREAMTSFRIPNLWREKNPRARLLPVVSLQFHPKDIGTLLIGYPEGAVLYSFKQNKALKFFLYEVPRGATGGDGDPRTIGQTRWPKLTHALWHPTGTFILTAHEDSSLVFWDPRDGRAIEARTVEATNINLPSAQTREPTSPGALASSVLEPYAHIAWCSKENPDDTGILLVGGHPVTSPQAGLTFIDLGMTPNYQTSSWDALTNHFRGPRRIHVLPTPPNAKVANFMVIPRSSPHYAGAHDPIAVLVSLSSGELVAISFPSGHPITPSNQLHVSLSLACPFVTKFGLAEVDRTRWLGMKESRQQGPPFLLGGMEATKQLKRHEDRSIIQTAHADGTIRLWDIGHGDDVENAAVIQADLARAVGRWDDLQITQMAMSGSTGELAVGLRNGEVVIFRLGRNSQFGKPPRSASPNEPPGRMTDISRRSDPTLKEGLLPLALTNDQQGPVTAMRLSEVGFLASGYDNGGLTIIDLRGPAIIHTALLSELQLRRSGSISGTIKGRRHSQGAAKEFATAIEFGVMTLDGDDYSSIAMFVGTNRGRLATFKILPSQSGRYTAQYAGITQLSDDRVVSISPISSDSGAPASASPTAVSGLQAGRKVSGVLVVTTTTAAHIFRPAHAKGASKTFDNVMCDAANVTRFETRGYALVGLFGDGTARAFSLPALKEIGTIRLNHVFDVKRFGETAITKTGDIIGWKGPSEIALASIWGAGTPIPPSADRLWDPTKPILPRPTISNLQWIAGTQYITPADLDILIGGPGRPPSKRMIAEMRAQQELEFQRQRESGRTSNPPARSDETYWQYMQRQIQERTENLGLASDSMDRTAEASASWSDQIDSFVQKQKRQAALGFIGSKFGL